MESYQTLYRLRVQHDYFEGKPCDAVGCRLSPQGVELARQRNLLFRQTAADEWAVSYDRNGAGFSGEGDILTLELYLADSHFTLYTRWPDFCPSGTYELELSKTGGDMDASKAIHPSKKRRDIGSGFCTVSLRLTNDMRQTSSKKKSRLTVLRFHARRIKWEYIFFCRSGSNIPETELRLEDEKDIISFNTLKPTTAYGNKGMSTTTKKAIPMRAIYASKLRLVQQEDGRQKRILLANIEPPTPGRFVTKDCIRQVCYY